MESCHVFLVVRVDPIPLIPGGNSEFQRNASCNHGVDLREAALSSQQFRETGQPPSEHHHSHDVTKNIPIRSVALSHVTYSEILGHALYLRND